MFFSILRRFKPSTFRQRNFAVDDFPNDFAIIRQKIGVVEQTRKRSPFDGGDFFRLRAQFDVRVVGARVGGKPKKRRAGRRLAFSEEASDVDGEPDLFEKFARNGVSRPFAVLDPPSGKTKRARSGDRRGTSND